MGYSEDGKAKEYLLPLKALKLILHPKAFESIFAIFKLISTLVSRIFLNSDSWVNLCILTFSFLWSSNLEFSISTLMKGLSSKYSNSALILTIPL